MRKGYLLVEMIVVIAVLVMVMVTFDQFFRTIIYELPRDSRLVQEDVVLLNAVKNIGADVASAKAVSQKAGGPDETPSLVIQQADGVVNYEFENGRILRRKSGSVQGALPDERTWSIPHGKVDMRVWNAKHGANAVELVACIEYLDLGKTRRKMANSFLFFAGMPWEPAK
jgi:hypothetical protein